MDFLLRYRKIALIVSSVLFVAIFLHLVGAYIYSDRTYIWEPGGSTSVSFVGDASNIDPMNPTNYGTGKIDDFVYNILFRSLIRYNSETDIYEWDLANCDISNLKKITCSLREDAIWSDGSNITTEDVFATKQFFENNAGSKNIRNAFKNANFKAENNNLIIETTGKDSNIIEAMTYPVLRSDVIDQIKNNRLKKESYITSGPFIFDGINDNTEYGFKNITFLKNPNYKKTVWLDKFSVRIFPDVATLERSHETIGVAIPPINRENLKLGNRLKPIKYAMYEFYGIFFHTDKLDVNIRNILHKYLASRFIENPPEVAGQIPQNSIFQTGGIIAGKETLAMNFEGFMTEKWFKRKYILLAETKNQSTTLESGGTIPKLKYFANGGGNSILYSEDPKGEITLRGRVPASTTAVIINDYQLREYKSGNTNFVYKVSTAIGNIHNGKNVYKLQLKQTDGNILTENLTIYHTTNKDEMNAYQHEVQKNLLAELNSPEKIAERENLKNEKITKIESLEDSLYYNNNLEAFTLKIAFVADKEASATYMNFATDSLRKIGIHVEPIALTTKELDQMIKENKKNYDMIIVGVKSPGTIAHMDSFFSSENGNANFSNITSKNFVALFDSLKNITEPTKALEIQNKIVNYMNEQSFFLPISRPEHTFYIDRNLKRVNVPKILVNTTDLAHILDTASIKEDYKLSFKNKNISGFFAWLQSFSH